jgi:hypothetical protein
MSVNTAATKNVTNLENKKQRGKAEQNHKRSAAVSEKFWRRLYEGGAVGYATKAPASEGGRYMVKQGSIYRNV